MVNDPVTNSKSLPIWTITTPLSTVSYTRSFLDVGILHTVIPSRQCSDSRILDVVLPLDVVVCCDSDVGTYPWGYDVPVSDTSITTITGWRILVVPS